MTVKLCICGGFCLLFVVMGISLLAGRGAWLIAGYNTMPKKERERYDERALCRFMGKLMLYCAACVLLMALMFCLVMLLVDLLYAFLDPRIRARYSKTK